ncbi:hypothetical protein ACHAXR_012088 [Thalassiosira sp. AJA248-18]
MENKSDSHDISSGDDDPSESCLMQNPKSLSMQEAAHQHQVMTTKVDVHSAELSTPSSTISTLKWVKKHIPSRSTMGLLVLLFSLIVLLISYSCCIMTSVAIMEQEEYNGLQQGHHQQQQQKEPSLSASFFWSVHQHHSSVLLESTGDDHNNDVDVMIERMNTSEEISNDDEEPSVITMMEMMRRISSLTTTNRNLSKQHHHHHKDKLQEPIDYSIHSCDSLSDLQTKYPKRFNKCDFAHSCNEGDGIIFPSLFCDENSDTNTFGDGVHHNHSSNRQLNMLILTFLSLTLLLLFRLLSSTTDEFFSPGLELFSLTLGLPPRFAGVTLLALGNGAPDVAATMNAILQDERRGYEMALGELTGTCMFVTSVILGVIVSLSGTGSDDKGRRRGVPCEGPLLRDISVLVLVCAVSMSYLRRGVVDYGFVYTMLGMYGVYVLVVLGADAYHIFYHLPSLSLGRAVDDDGVVEEDEEEGCSGSDTMDKKKGGVLDPQLQQQMVLDEHTPLMILSSNNKTSFFRSDSAPGPRCHRSQHDNDHHRQNHQHLYHHNSLPIHSHSLGDTFIEAMSNYSCNYEEPPFTRHTHCEGNHNNASSSDKTDTKLAAVTTTTTTTSSASSPTNNRVSPIAAASASTSKAIFKQTAKEGSTAVGRGSGSSGWAPIQDDGTEPLVIFHPHHAVHPHHGSGGLLFLRSKSNTSTGGSGGGGSFSGQNTRQHSWSLGGNNEKLKKSSSCDAAAAAVASSASSTAQFPVVAQHHHHDATTTVASMQITTSASNDAEGGNDDNEHPNNTDIISVAAHRHSQNSDSNRPNSWGEAWSSNLQEFIDHWRDFFTDIYNNEENSILDVILLSVELPFTIVRKLTNPVPCDGYYCRPLVAISITLSPLWLRYYFSDQFGIDLFSSYIGYIVSAITLTMGLVVIRYAPGGEGPMDFYMVVPLTLYGFAIAATWLDSIADKLVELLELFGILLQIPSTIMGLTVLAFGNSLQDLVANVSLSKKGLSTMATTACLAGPIFNLCVGLGFGFWALMKSTGKDEIRVELPRNIATGFWFTIANCALIVFAGVVVGKGLIGQGYGYVACGLYIVYVVTSLYI